MTEIVIKSSECKYRLHGNGETYKTTVKVPGTGTLEIVSATRETGSPLVYTYHLPVSYQIVYEEAAPPIQRFTVSIPAGNYTEEALLATLACALNSGSHSEHYSTHVDKHAGTLLIVNSTYHFTLFWGESRWAARLLGFDDQTISSVDPHAVMTRLTSTPTGLMLGTRRADSICRWNQYAIEAKTSCFNIKGNTFDIYPSAYQPEYETLAARCVTPDGKVLPIRKGMAMRKIRVEAGTTSIGIRSRWITAPVWRMHNAGFMPVPETSDWSITLKYTRDKPCSFIFTGLFIVLLPIIILILFQLL